MTRDMNFRQRALSSLLVNSFFTVQSVPHFNRIHPKGMPMTDKASLLAAVLYQLANSRGMERMVTGNPPPHSI